MSNDDKYTPSAWHWAITPEQIQEIKQSNFAILKDVFADNYQTFCKMATKYCSKWRKMDLVEDCIHQIYVDLPYYDFTNTLTFFKGIKNSFWKATGTSTKHACLSLDKPLTSDSDTTLGDMLPSTTRCFEDIERKEQEEAVLVIISNQKQLTDLQKDMLTAYAFGVKCYKGIFKYEYYNCRKSIPNAY